MYECNQSVKEKEKGSRRGDIQKGTKAGRQEGRGVSVYVCTSVSMYICLFVRYLVLSGDSEVQSLLSSRQRELNS